MPPEQPGEAKKPPESSPVGTNNPPPVREANIIVRPELSEVKVKVFTTIVAKSSVLVLVLFLSTGPLVRRLFYLTFRNTCALLVGAFWLAGDILPTIALVKVYNDCLSIDLVAPLKDRRRITHLHIIVALNIGFYTIDFFLDVICLQMRTTETCGDLVARYRLFIFHVQIFLAIVHLLKPWTWGRYDGKHFVPYLKFLDCLKTKLVEDPEISVASTSSRSRAKSRKTEPSRSRSRGTSSRRPAARARPRTRASSRKKTTDSREPCTRSHGAVNCVLIL